MITQKNIGAFLFVIVGSLLMGIWLFAANCGPHPSPMPPPPATAIATMVATASPEPTLGPVAPSPMRGALPEPSPTPTLGDYGSGGLLGAHCGVERWSVKTLADKDAQRINRTPQVATVRQLAALSAPRSLPNTRLAAERQTYTLTVRLVEAAAEADSDIHLVVADPSTGQTMIVEFPDAASCAHGTSAGDIASMTAARQAFVAAEGMPGPSTQGFKRLSGTATITGVLFLDEIHGQAGVARNGAELHPALSFVIARNP